MAEIQEALHFLDYWRVIRSRKEVVIAVFLVVVLTGVLFTLAMPKEYSASSIIQVKEQQPDLPVWDKERWKYDPLFLRTQFEIIQSAPVIEEVIQRRGLTRKLAEAYGYSQLDHARQQERTFKIVSGALRVQHFRDTNLIEIQMRFSEPLPQANVEAAEAANAIFRAYQEQSLARSRMVTEGALAALRASLDEQARRVTNIQARVEQIRRDRQITVFSSLRGSETAIDKQRLARLEDEHLKVRMELEAKRARLEKVQSLNTEELLKSAPYLVGDPALAALVKQKRETEVQLREMTTAALGANHPDVLRLTAVIRELDAKIGDALKGLKYGLQAEYEATLAQCNYIEQMLHSNKVSEISAEGSGYREFDKATEELEHAKRLRDAMEIRYLQEQIQLNIPATNVEMIERAKPPDVGDFVSPNIVLNVLLSVLLGLCAGVGLAYFVEYIDTSVKTIDDVEKFMNLPVVGVIPQKVSAFTNRDAYKQHAEAYRMLRTNVRFSERVKNGRTFCVTSGSMAEGKSLTAFNLGYVCAQMGDRVVIVDADMYRPRQHKILGVSNKVGLANILVGQVSLAEAMVKTEVPNLDFLPSGRLSSGTHGLLDTSRMKELVKELAQRYDFVIFDAPPVIGVSDAMLLVRDMDGVLMVVQHRKYPRSVSVRARAMVEQAGARIIGVVLNKINIARDYSYYYHYGYYYYPRRNPADEESGQAQPR